MTQSSRQARVLSRLVVPAVAAALVGTTAGTATAAAGRGDAPVASGPAKGAARTAAKAGWRVPTPLAPSFFLSGILRSGQMYVYRADGMGGFEPRSGAYVWPHLKYVASVDPDLTGHQDGAYHVMDDGTLNLWRGGELKRVTGGWGRYDTVFSPGTLARAAHPDLVARDRQGVLWRFQTKANGTLSAGVRIGPGWGQYTRITGLGDLSGDNKADIVARDKRGVLWLYKGTGDARKPFATRTRVGGGWNRFDKLVTTGDVDGDGHSDLLARDPKGDLWLYKGTGKAAAPFKPKNRIGKGFNQYRDLF
ncbi:FG-GAP repeat domain-containing protein [Streptomyces huiliensis]|uniref:FG-GAP repeat domain-containing protein n=1 Tax=Streptomyces huiliensis TaxID=2876027 RepID=UPI001CBE94D1|nr:VCBS repeat-containing protein [Streptomyces huiliensis]MBZ4323374.1 VCBS repeat-containing protein [Streptomyces huiliensis]